MYEGIRVIPTPSNCFICTYLTARKFIHTAINRVQYTDIRKDLYLVIFSIFYKFFNVEYYATSRKTFFFLF